MEEFDREVETTLELTKGCKALAMLISFLLTFSPFIVCGVLWFIENFIYGFAGLIITYIATGIIVSKIRIASIDFRISEISYKTYDVVKIYLSKNYC